ncbi:NAD(P)H-quinone dehydrogenase [Yaniella flava]|uniref:NAD(P)H-quinone dehydrogenase n=1 Tax=Yaniella flava TaxID=287930 RepID=A0ABP5FGP0_9MICC
MSTFEIVPRPSITIIGGGPGGYEAALVASKFGAEVTLIERNGIGGSAVLTDVVPSKTLIASADSRRRVLRAPSLGLQFDAASVRSNMELIDRRLLRLAAEQSEDIRRGLQNNGVRIMMGEAKFVEQNVVEVTTMEGDVEQVTSDAVLIATGASPRELDTAQPDGERIFNWKQVYAMDELPEHMVVVGSGVTGAEFASAYQLLGSNVTLVSSRETLLPGEDPDAAKVLEDAFSENGVNVISRTRAEAVTRTKDGVRVDLTAGGYVEGSHCLLAVGGIPNTSQLGLEDIGVDLTASGHIKIDAVSRTSVPGVYAAGDCTGRLALASVAAQQGRIAVNHILGDVVKPFSRNQVASNIFTSPEIATVGITDEMIATGDYQVDEYMISMSTNPRAKMMNVDEGFVKIFARRGSGHVVGGVIVAPGASDLIYALSLAVSQKLHVDDLADTFTIYPSLTGTVAEVARQLHRREEF